jgi:hypothetical protein
MYNTIEKHSRAPDQKEMDYSKKNQLKKTSCRILKDFAIESNNVQKSNQLFFTNRFKLSQLPIR